MKIDLSMRSSIIFKLAAIAFLSLVLLIPTNMINGLINEREIRRDQAADEVSQKWGSAQTIAGPVLTIPYRQTVMDANNKPIEQTKTAYFLPKNLKIIGQLNPEKLKRGIYEVVAYNSELTLEGDFASPDWQGLGVAADKINWNEAALSLGIADMRGVKDNIDLKWNGQPATVKPGADFQTSGAAVDYDPINSRFPDYLPEKTMPDQASLNSGVNAQVALNQEKSQGQFQVKLNLNGSRQISFLPLGAVSEVELKSSWNAPSFNGAFLPDERTVADNGFSAKWKILELNRNIPQSGESNIIEANSSAFGVRLLIPVDEYQQNTRSIKYAFLLIGLTFAIFFFVEILNGVRVHAIQYLLVGLALVLFYSLLLSFSEYVDFNYAYLIAAAAIVAMITLYSRVIFKNRTLTLVQGGVLSFIYAFIYIIIQLEDYSLLVGSLGLFLILAIVMFISRRVDWYDIKEIKTPEIK